ATQLDGAGLDRVARGQPWQHGGVREGARRSARVGAHQRHAAARGGAGRRGGSLRGEFPGGVRAASPCRAAHRRQRDQHRQPGVLRPGGACDSGDARRRHHRPGRGDSRGQGGRGRRRRRMRAGERGQRGRRAAAAAGRRDRPGAARRVGAHRAPPQGSRLRDALGRALLHGNAALPFQDQLAHARDALTDLFDGLAGQAEERAALQDEIVSYGERLSACLLAAALATAGVPARAVDARRCIITDETHGRAAPLPADTNRRTEAELVPLLDAALVPVLGGYIAATPGGRTTTLGRGGSDYTAALVGAALAAREIQIWTDVSGVLTADPRVVPGARPIPRLSYAEAAELAYFGAKVLHPKTIEPATARRIPVRICNSLAPDDPGTVVAAEPAVWPGAVKAIAHKTGITVLQIASTRML